MYKHDCTVRRGGLWVACRASAPVLSLGTGPVVRVTLQVLHLMQYPCILLTNLVFSMEPKTGGPVSV